MLQMVHVIAEPGISSLQFDSSQSTRENWPEHFVCFISFHFFFFFFLFFFDRSFRSFQALALLLN